MSRFYASINGNRGEATRCGHSMITGHVRGWQSGVRVDGHADNNGEDMFYVYATGGSSAAYHSTLIGTVRVVDGQPVFTPETRTLAA